MATSKEAPKKQEEAAADAPPAPKKGKKLLIIVGLAVVVALGGGLLAGKLLFGGGAKKAEHGEEAAAAEHKDEKAAPTYHYDPKKPPVYVNLDAFTVNLQGDGSEQFLQVVATLQVADEKVAELLKQYMPQIRHEYLALMSGKKASDVTTQDGRLDLAEEMKEVANEILGYEPPPKKRRKNSEPDMAGPVVGVFFTQFIVQ